MLRKDGLCDPKVKIYGSGIYFLFLTEYRLRDPFKDLQNLNVQIKKGKGD